MASLTQTVRWDGTGDYTDLVAGISGIIAAGMSSGSLTELYLDVDSGYYSGAFDITIPNSGQLNIIGSGSWFEPLATCYINGIYSDQSNFVMSDFRVIGTGLLSQNILSISSGIQCELTSIHFIGVYAGIINSGSLYLSNIDAIGRNAGYFAIAPTGFMVVNNSNIGYFNVGLSGDYINSNNNNLLENKIGFISDDLLQVSFCLINGTSGIVANGGQIYAEHLTIDTNWQCIQAVNTYINMRTSILSTDYTYSITGTNVSGIVSGCCFNDVGWDPTLSINGVNISGNPLFNNPMAYDYRLKLKDTIGSPCIEVIDPGILDPSVELTTDQGQLVLHDSKGPIDPLAFGDFIYKQGNTILFSDYQKETKYAEAFKKYKPVSYKLFTNVSFSVSDVILQPAMDTNASLFPYDWDFRTFNTTEITDRHEYIIPRSILDVKATISPYVGNWLNSVIFSVLTKQNIRTYIYKDFRGVSYDYDISGPARSTIWAIEGRNQTLIKLNMYTGEVLDQYPLLTAHRTEKYIYPSGLIAAGVFGDKYKYILTSNPNIEFLSDSPDGGFKWICTNLDLNKDVRGIKAYKNNLYITLSEYNDTIFDRSYIPTYPENSGVGKLLRYSNNGTFEHYIANYAMDKAPTQLYLVPNNAYPTDLTIYEDGTILIADYLNQSGIYRYRFAYDYALIQSSYDRESRVLLRENYENVEL